MVLAIKLEQVTSKSIACADTAHGHRSGWPYRPVEHLRRKSSARLAKTLFRVGVKQHRPLGRDFHANLRPFTRPVVAAFLDDDLGTGVGQQVNIGHAAKSLGPVSYTHLTLPTTPYV